MRGAGPIGRTAAPATCSLTLPAGTRTDVHVKVPVSGDAPFELTLTTPHEVTLGGTHDGQVDFGEPLAFHAVLSERWFSAARALDLAGGLVHIEPGAALRQTGMTPSGAIVTVRLFHDDVTAEVAGLAVPCDAISLAANSSTPPALAAGRPTSLAPRDGRIELHSKPGSRDAITLVLDSAHPAVFEELEARAGYHRLRFRSDAGWIVGWADDRDLVPGTTPPKAAGGAMYGLLPAKAPHGGYAGPLDVPAGTLVYTSVRGDHAWATVAQNGSFDVRIARGAEWAQLTGIRYLAGGVMESFAFGLPTHAWIRLPTTASRQDER